MPCTFCGNRLVTEEQSKNICTSCQVEATFRIAGLVTSGRLVEMWSLPKKES